MLGGYAESANKGSATGYDFALARLLENGALDPTFGSGGRLLTDFGNTTDRLEGLALDAAGYIVAAGWSGASNNPPARNFALARYTPDGQLDTTFGSGGKTTTDFVGNLDVALAVAIQPDGQIVAAGTTVIYGMGEYFALARYNPDGSLDTSFDSGTGKNGVVITTSFGGNDDVAYGLALQPDGKIVALGSSIFGDNIWYFSLARYYQ
ncbi:MAG TPA: hypothetical protein VM182_10830 [Terriglobia bacterium]|nr:hypothetical protein [Terriglobia bacterium]